ncbi:MAG: DUF2218 domain-containing protein [Phototrophicales bacterium]|nr:MAG: DUF2218 domain-containing protein [Phototrophicales bacterium]
MRYAQAVVRTSKASRYLKALCNHFDRKVTATYDDNRGWVQFGFGECRMDADDTQLVFGIRAEDDEHFARVMYVVKDHLERFSGDEGLQVDWVEYPFLDIQPLTNIP